MNGSWTHDHWIPFRQSNRVSYQVISSMRSQSQLCTANPISSSLQCQISFCLILWYVTTFILNEFFLRYADECGRMNWYIFVFTNAGFLEVATENLLVSDLNPRPQNFVLILWPTDLSYHDLNLHSGPTLYSCSNFIICSISGFISANGFVNRHVCFNWNLFEVIRWV